MGGKKAFGALGYAADPCTTKTWAQSQAKVVLAFHPSGFLVVTETGISSRRLEAFGASTNYTSLALLVSFIISGNVW